MKRPYRLELTGSRFGNWIVLEKGDLGSRGEIFWLCKCDCGNEKLVRAGLLRSGNSSSCGCTRGKHRMSKSRTYKSWDSMRQRCNNPNAPDYSRYGGRGIEVCRRWQSSFQNFLDDMGERPEGKTLDRADNSKGYEPDNCRWATPTEQQENRRNTPKVEYNGNTVLLSSLSTSSGIPMKILLWRLQNQWDLNRALETPIRMKRTT